LEIKTTRHGSGTLHRKYDILFIPRKSPYGSYSIELIPRPNEDETIVREKNWYLSQAELNNAIERLGIAGSEKESILEALAKGYKYRILSIPIPLEVVKTFREQVEHQQSIM